MKNYRLFVLLGILVFNYSCRTKVKKLQIANTNDEVVVYGFLNPQIDTITIGLGLAVGNNSNKQISLQYEDLENSSVTLESNGQSYPLSLLKKIGGTSAQTENVLYVFYGLSSAFPILEGATYQIKVNNGDKINASAVTTVPYSDFDFESELTKINYTSNYGYKLKLKTTISNPNQNLSALRTSILFNNRQYGYEYALLDNVSLPKYSSIGTIVEENIFYYSSISDRDTFEVSVSNISGSVFEYIKSAREGDLDAGNPFVEPVTRYTNIEGGYGVFGAINPKTMLVIY